MNTLVKCLIIGSFVLGCSQKVPVCTQRPLPTFEIYQTQDINYTNPTIDINIIGGNYGN